MLGVSLVNLIKTNFCYCVTVASYKVDFYCRLPQSGLSFSFFLFNKLYHFSKWYQLYCHPLFQTVVFSSMTSLQKEEFFDLVATSQARRLDDQRADFQNPSPEAPGPAPQQPRRSSSAPETFSQPRTKSRRSSWKVIEFGQTAPKPAAKEELYNMILTSQVRLHLRHRSFPLDVLCFSLLSVHVSIFFWCLNNNTVIINN